MANRVPIDWEARCRALYEESVATLDLRTRSRLTEARHAALAAGTRARAGVRRTIPGWSWTVAGIAAALLIAVVLWVGTPIGGSSAGAAGQAPRAEDAALVASVGAADDPAEMMRDDADFYTWAAGVSAPAERDQAD
jgi:hypothetical protein